MKQIIFLNKLDSKEKNSYSLNFENFNNKSLNNIIKSKQNAWLQQIDLWHYNISKKIRHCGRLILRLLKKGVSHLRLSSYG